MTICFFAAAPSFSPAPPAASAPRWPPRWPAAAPTSLWPTAMRPAWPPSPARRRAHGVTRQRARARRGRPRRPRSAARSGAGQHDRVNVLVNNAGVALAGDFADVTMADFEWLFDINFWAPVRLTKALMYALAREPAAHIVNVSSLFGIVAPPGQAAYCAAKFALRGFSESLRHELEGGHVSLTVVHPGGIRTEIANSARIPQGIDPAQARAQTQEFNKLAAHRAGGRRRADRARHRTARQAPADRQRRPHGRTAAAPVPGQLLELRSDARPARPLPARRPSDGEPAGAFPRPGHPHAVQAQDEGQHGSGAGAPHPRRRSPAGAQGRHLHAGHGRRRAGRVGARRRQPSRPRCSICTAAAISPAPQRPTGRSPAPTRSAASLCSSRTTAWRRNTRFPAAVEDAEAAWRGLLDSATHQAA